MSLSRNRQHLLHDGSRWFVPFNMHSALLGFSTRAILNDRFALGGGRLFLLANVCRAHIKASSLGWEQANCVEELSVQHFHTDNGTVTGWQELLYERGMVNA